MNSQGLQTLNYSNLQAIPAAAGKRGAPRRPDLPGRRILYNMFLQMKKLLSHRAISMALTFLPLFVFLRVASHYNFTDDGWMRAFITGAAISAAIIALFAVKRVPFRDLLLAFGLLLISGAIAFLADIRPVTAGYKRFQGSVFMAWYLTVRVVFALAPGFLSGFVYDPYKRATKLAAAFAAAGFLWSLSQKDLVLSAFLPIILMMTVFAAYERYKPTI